MRPTALVTGASSGIGAAACLRLRTEGWHVIGLARRPSPNASESRCADVADSGAIQETFRTIPPLRLLVHAAAIVGPLGPLVGSDQVDWWRTIEVNLLGTYNVLRAALSGPLAGERAVAIHMTTGAVATSKANWSAYNVSKGGAEQLIRSAANDVLGDDVGLCALDPGFTETPMQADIRSRDFPDGAHFARRRGHSPKEVAEAIWLLSQRPPDELNGRVFRVGEL